MSGRRIGRRIGHGVVAALVLTTASVALRPTPRADAAPPSPMPLILDYQMNESSTATVIGDSGPAGLDGSIGADVVTGCAAQTPHSTCNGSSGTTHYRWEFTSPTNPPAKPERLVTVPDSPVLDFGTSDFAVEFRYRTTYSFGNIVQKGQNQTFGGYFKFEQPSGRMTCLVKDAEGDQIAAKAPPEHATNDGQWHTIRCEKAENYVRLYVDGVQVATTVKSDPDDFVDSISNGKVLSIGGKHSCNQGEPADETKVTCDYFSGDIDWLRIEKEGGSGPVNQPPNASVTSSCDGLVCEFDSSTSNDPDGTITNRSWDFGDGTTGTGTTPTHTYTTGGTYTVTLTITDDDGAVDADDTQIQLNIAPTADFAATCDKTFCTFDSTASTDPDGTITNRSWDFGDGTTDTGTTPTHTYTTGGTYTVTLTITDDDGATDTIDQSAVATPNVAPNATFTSTCGLLTCEFDSTASTDPDGTITNRSWDFGDGTTDTGTTPTHTYTTGGTYTVTLTTTDDDGATDTVDTQIQLNIAPTADFTSSCLPLVCEFDSTASTDPDGTITDRSWDFGDGTTDTGTTPIHTYTTGGTYTVALTITDDDGATDTVARTIVVDEAASSPPSAMPSAMTALTPFRLFDTRPEEAAPGPKGVVAADERIDITVAGVGAIPDDITAVAINLTVVAIEAPSFVTAWPAGQPRPTELSSLNVVEPGTVRANLAIIPVGDDGSISVYTLRDAHLLGDVVGYFTESDATESGRLVPRSPSRLLDTRPGPDPGPKGALEADTELAVDVAGNPDVPPEAAAVIVNVTMTEPSAPAFLTVWPEGARPTASSVNVSAAGGTSANMVIVPIGADGTIRLYSNASTHVVIDLLGYVTGATAPSTTTGLFVPLDPSRAFDSRPSEPAPGPKGAIAADSTVTFEPGIVGGIPETASGVVLNVTYLSTAPGYVTLWATGTDQPATSNVNASVGGDVRANGVIVDVGDDGGLDAYALTEAHVVADVFGYLSG